MLVADEGAADDEEGFVDVLAAVVATIEAPVGVKPGDRALHYPAFFPRPEPWPVPRLAIRGVMPRSLSACRCLLLS